nr:MAG TPA: hypothetical protein [Caudoviricetes sp.]
MSYLFFFSYSFYIVAYYVFVYCHSVTSFLFYNNIIIIYKIKAKTYYCRLLCFRLLPQCHLFSFLQ